MPEIRNQNGVPVGNAQAPIEPREEDRFLRRVAKHHDMSDDERDYLRALLGPAQTISAGDTLLVEGESYDRMFVLLSGWAYRYKLLDDGRRQIFGFLLPGDFAGLRGSLMAEADDSVQALVDCRVSSFPVSRIIEMCRDQSELAMTVLWDTARDQSMLAEHAMRLGRRNARERMAHLFLELYHRLEHVGATEENRFEMPVTQEILADALGLSVVHVNRTLQQLKREGLVHQDDGWLIFRDIGQLKKLAGFNDRYLDMESE